MPSEDMPAAKGLTRTSGSRIRQERERRAWTQAELADRIGSTRINISRWENGASVPGPYYRQRLSELFGKSVQELGFLSTFDEEDTNEASTFTDRVELSGSTPLADITGSSYREQVQGTSSITDGFDDRARSTPLWHIPYRPNHFFTGRKEILQHLHAEFRNHQTSGGVLALSGLGGVGKTQIAIEYAYTYRQDYQAIFWLNASTHVTMSSELVAMAALLDLSEQQEREEVIGKAIKRWLATHTGWLLILDNVDSLEEVVNFLPVYSAGNVLLTTRLQVVGTVAQRIVVENMTRKEGVAFLLRRAKLLTRGELLEQVTEENRVQAARIVDALGGLPLALDQAGAYIEETQCGLSQYLERYKTNSKELLQRRGDFPLEHPDPVATTWQISFEEIEKRSTVAAELLCLCAFLSPESIPEDLFILGASELSPILSKELGDALKLDVVLRPLHLYSLIHRVPETRSFDIHRLVQAVLRQNLSFARQKQWSMYVIRALERVFPEPEIKNWERCQQFLPQVSVCNQLSEKHGVLILELGHLCQRAGEYASSRALYAQAEEFFSKAIAVYEKLSTSERAYTVEIALNCYHLGELYRVLGRYVEAETLIQRALDQYDHSPPPDQLDIVNTLNSLGELYHNIRRYEEAEELFQRALVITESLPEIDHYIHSIPLHHLARLYWKEERYGEAEELFLQVIRIQEQSADNEVDLAVTLNNLATLYRAQGEYKRAEKLLEQTLYIEEKILGPNNPRTATALQNLGIVYIKQEKYEEAETHLRQAFAIKENILGSKHVSTVRTMTNLAFVYKMQKRYEEAKVLLQEALDYDVEREQSYTAIVLRNLANVYHEEENFEEAEQLYVQALALSEKNTLVSQADMNILLEAFAELYQTLGREEEAERLLKRMLDTSRE